MAKSNPNSSNLPQDQRVFGNYPYSHIIPNIIICCCTILLKELSLNTHNVCYCITFAHIALSKSQLQYVAGMFLVIEHEFSYTWCVFVLIFGDDIRD